MTINILALESLSFLLDYVTCDIFNSEVAELVPFRRSRVVAVIGKGFGTTAIHANLVVEHDTNECSRSNCNSLGEPCRNNETRGDIRRMYRAVRVQWQSSVHSCLGIMSSEDQ